VVLEQRAATEELNATNRELEQMIEDLLAGRPELRSSLEKAVGEAANESVASRNKPLAEDLTLTQLQREAARSLQKARDAIREAGLLRLRSKRLRAALRQPVSKRARAVPANTLSKRERQVLGLIVAGKSSKEIAAELGISFRTAVTHRASIMGKLDVHEIASVVREAILRGLV
jgi:DNA-binding CsgD family transcriptional regulator